MASVNSFNSQLGGLRERSNMGDNFSKAVSDRINILKASEPDSLAQKTSQTEVKGAEAVGALKTISDVKDTAQKIQKGYGAIKGGAQNVSNMVQGKGVSTNAPVKASASGKLDDSTLPRGNPAGGASHLQDDVSGNEKVFQGLNLGKSDTAGLFDESKLPSKMNVNGSLTKGSNGMGDVVNSLKGDTNLLKNASGDLASTSSNLHSAVSAGSKVAEEGGEMAGKAIAGAGAVADALGPVGDLIGLGMAIYGGIKSKGYFKRQDTASQQAQTAIATPNKPQATPSTNVSLDTSKMGASMGASHY